MRSATLLLLPTLTMLSGFSSSEAQCRPCSRLKRSDYLGIKSVREYVSRASDVTIFGSEKSAKRAGYARFSGCSAQNSIRSAARKLPCRPAFGISADNVYLCPNQLRPFKSETAAQAKEFSPYTACGTRTPTPTPTATPAVTPKPLTRSITHIERSGSSLTPSRKVKSLVLQ